VRGSNKTHKDDVTFVSFIVVFVNCLNVKVILSSDQTGSFPAEQTLILHAARKKKPQERMDCNQICDLALEKVSKTSRGFNKDTRHVMWVKDAYEQIYCINHRFLYSHRI